MPTMSSFRTEATTSRPRSTPKQTPALALLLALGACASPSPDRAAGKGRDSTELAALYTADQADRTPGTAPSDWTLVQKNDAAREARVRELLTAGGATTGRDYFHAAMVFQHASEPEGIQLAHELAMIGAGLGNRESRWLAAASYDRLLMYWKRPQRFGTQYRSNEQGQMRLYEVAPGVTDAMRAASDVPSLAAAQAREKEMQEQLEELAKTLKAKDSGK